MQEGNDRQLAFWDNLHSTHLERIPQGLLVHSPDSGRVDLTRSEHVVPSSFEMSPEIGIPFPIKDIDQRATLQPHPNVAICSFPLRNKLHFSIQGKDKHAE